MSVLTKHPTLRVIVTILCIPVMIVSAPLIVIVMLLLVIYDVAAAALIAIEELFHA